MSQQLGTDVPLRQRILWLLTNWFSESDLRNLCFHLTINYDDLDDIGRANRARELVLECERHNHLEGLLQTMQMVRPDLFKPKPRWKHVRNILSGSTFILFGILVFLGGAFAVGQVAPQFYPGGGIPVFPIAVSESESNATSPEQTLRDYYDLLNTQQLRIAYDTRIADCFYEHSSSWEEYQEYWSGFDEVHVAINEVGPLTPETNLKCPLSDTQRSADYASKIIATVTYTKGGRVSSDILQFILIRDTLGSPWLIYQVEYREQATQEGIPANAAA